MKHLALSLLCLLVCTGVAAQETTPLFISSPSGPDTLLLLLERTEGYGPFQAASTLLSERGPDAASDPWFPGIEAVTGVPDTLLEPSVRMFNFQMEQHAFQTYRRGLLDKNFYLFWREVANSDTTRLSLDFVDQMVAVVVGRDSLGNEIALLDTDNDEDFSDETPLVFATPGDPQPGEAVDDVPTREVTFEYFDGDSIRTASARLVVTNITMPGGSSITGISRKEHHAGRFRVNGQPYQMAVSNRFAHGLYQKDNVQILLGVGAQALASEEEGNIIVRIGDVVELAGVPYRIDAINLTGDELRFVKVGVEEAQDGSRIGVRAANIEATTLQGDAFDLASMHGKYVLLDFWGTWCPPCRAEIPYLKDAHAAFGTDALAIVGIALDERESIAAYVEELSIPWPQIPQAWEHHPIVEAYTIQGYPTTLLINPEGMIVERNPTLRGQALIETLGRYLGKEEAFAAHILAGNHTFTLDAPEAQRVHVVGSFSNEQKLPLYQIEGRWVRGVDLAPGRYAYRFVVDGNEQTDPMNANERKDGAADIGHSVLEIQD